MIIKRLNDILTTFNQEIGIVAINLLDNQIFMSQQRHTCGLFHLKIQIVHSNKNDVENSCQTDGEPGPV